MGPSEAITIAKGLQDYGPWLICVALSLVVTVLYKRLQSLNDGHAEALQLQQERRMDDYKEREDKLHTALNSTREALKTAVNELRRAQGA